MATNYLANRDNLVLSIHIVDSRHEPTIQDLQLHEWLQQNEKPHLTIAQNPTSCPKRVEEKFGAARRVLGPMDSGLFCSYQYGAKRFENDQPLKTHD